MIRQWPLVGRTEELQLIARATRAAGDRARGIVLSGSAGVGKTRLAREAVAACGRRGARRHRIVSTTSATANAPTRPMYCAESMIDLPQPVSPPR